MYHEQRMGESEWGTRELHSSVAMWPKRYEWTADDWNGKKPLLFSFNFPWKTFRFTSVLCMTWNPIFSRRPQKHREKKLNRSTKSVQRFLFLLWAARKKTARQQRQECILDTCSLYTSGVAFCCVLAFALLIYIWSKNFTLMLLCTINNQKLFYSS